MNGIKILGMGRSVPARVVTNDDMARIVDTSDEWISSRTGIRTRHHCQGETHTQLCREAAQRALERAGVRPEEVGACIVATVTAQTLVPSTACLLQRDLGLPEDIPCFDLSAACTGFLFALHTMECLLNASARPFGLVVGCEVLSRFTDFTDRSTCVLFGDGAGAAIFRRADTPFALTLGARGSDVLHAGGPNRNGSAPITMDGRAVFRFAVETLPKCLHAVLDETQLTLGDLSWVVCHQANSRIIDHCVKALNADPAKFYKNMDRHGNTSAASIPVALNELAERGLLPAGQPLACIGFGGGLTWGGAIFQYRE